MHSAISLSEVLGTEFFLKLSDNRLSKKLKVSSASFPRTNHLLFRQALKIFPEHLAIEPKFLCYWNVSKNEPHHFW